ncbi:glycosyltransferase family 2 protein [Microbacterium keratanolyticum]
MRSNDVQVWIVNYESSHLIAACVKGLTDDGVASIHVLDNGSSPLEKQKIREELSTFPQVTLHDSETNLGFGGGHNLLSRLTATSPESIVWLLNPDTTIESGTTSKLTTGIARSVADIVSPVILTNRAGKPRIWYSGGMIDRSRGSIQDSQLGRDPRRLAESDPVLETQFITGAAPMMKRETFSALQGFNEDLFLYWEDVDFSIRAADAGYRLRVMTDARIFHAEGGSQARRSVRTRTYYYISRNRLLVCRREGTRGLALVFGSGFLPLLRMIAHTWIRDGRGRIQRTTAIIRGCRTALITR